MPGIKPDMTVERFVAGMTGEAVRFNSSWPHDGGEAARKLSASARLIHSVEELAIHDSEPSKS